MNHGEEVLQCRGVTLNGTRCSRKGNHLNVNGYCRHHNNQAPDDEAAAGGGSLSSIELSSIGGSEGGEKVPQCRGVTRNGTPCSRNGNHLDVNGYCRQHKDQAPDDEAAGGGGSAQDYYNSQAPDYGAPGGGGVAHEYQTPPETDTEEGPPEHTPPPAARSSFLSRLLWSQTSSSPSPGSHIGMDESHSDSASVSVNPIAADAESDDEHEYLVDKSTADEAVRIVIEHFMKRLREQQMMFESKINLIQAENQVLKASAGKKTKIGRDQYNRAVVEHLNQY